MTNPVTPRLPPIRSWEAILIAALLGFNGVGLNKTGDVADELRAIRQSLVEISQTLAVAVTRVEDHDRRIQNLEDGQRVLHGPPSPRR